MSDLKTPTLEDCREGWLQHKDTIHAFSQKYNKPILFTEYGYRSVDFAGKQPWRSDRDMNQVNFEAQKNATQALLERFGMKTGLLVALFGNGFMMLSVLEAKMRLNFRHKTNLRRPC